MTLRITRKTRSPARVTLEVEGRIVAAWAALLESECFDLLRSRIAVRLHLAGVGFVDRAGVEALERLSREGVEICCSSGPVAGVLEGEGIRVVTDQENLDDETR